MAALHPNIKLLIFSFISGEELYHKVALLDRQTRESLPNAGLLDQVKVLQVKEVPRLASHLKYAL